MPREMAVEPMPQQATGESAPKSWKFAALSPGVETAGAARDGCRAGAPASHGGKCTKIAGNRGTFPVPRDVAVEPMPQQATGKVHQNRGSGVHSRQETQKTRTGHSAVEKTCRPRHKREGPAAKRWEGLVFSTAECSRGTRAIEKVVTITRFRRHLPGDGKCYCRTGSRP